MSPPQRQTGGWRERATHVALAATPLLSPGFGPGSDILDKFGLALVGKLVERAMLRHRKISAREINRIGEEGENFTFSPRKVYVIRKPNVGLPVFF